MSKLDSLPINENLPVGTTELDPDDLAGLIPDYISTRGDLNEFEKTNITNAISWLRKRNFKYQQILTLEFFFELHTKMFDKTWKWAGTLRRLAVNIGNTPTEQIQMRIKNVLDNTLYRIEHQAYVIDEICIRLHHECVWIHPFPNGNGRFSRVICDKLRCSLGGTYFKWGNSSELITLNQNRANYIAALRAADNKDYKPLIAFANAL